MLADVKNGEKFFAAARKMHTGNFSITVYATFVRRLHSLQMKILGYG
jgi:hypothetical protein